MDRKNRFLVIFLIVFILVSFAFVFPDLKYQWHLTYEDGIVENLGALAFLAVALFFFIFFFRARRIKAQSGLLNNRQVVFLVLGLLFFVAFGEEISWGQRLFGWDTPENWAVRNVQGETNLHNMDFFLSNKKTAEIDNALLREILTISPGRLFLYFWILLLVAIPILDKFNPWSKLFRRFGIPIAPAWAGILMVANLLIANLIGILVKSQYVNNYKTVDEFMEMNYAVILLGLATYWYWDKVYLEKENQINVT